MARKTILVCDNCGAEVEESKGAVMRLNYTDARRGVQAGGSVRHLRREDAGSGGGETGPAAQVGRLVGLGETSAVPLGRLAKPS